MYKTMCTLSLCDQCFASYISKHTDFLQHCSILVLYSSPSLARPLPWISFVTQPNLQSLSRKHIIFLFLPGQTDSPVYVCNSLHGSSKMLFVAASSASVTSWSPLSLHMICAPHAPLIQAQHLVSNCSVYMMMGESVSLSFPCGPSF